jgi:hypothetical protein
METEPKWNQVPNLQSWACPGSPPDVKGYFLFPACRGHRSPPFSKWESDCLLLCCLESPPEEKAPRCRQHTHLCCWAQYFQAAELIGQFPMQNLAGSGAKLA